MNPELKATLQILRAVAKELAQRAKDAMPELREGEKFLREWYADGVYGRETALNGEIRIYQYDFREATLIEPEVSEREEKATA